MASKLVERMVLDICVRTVPGFPNSAAADHESPDFLVVTPDKTVGIEMQEFIQGATPTGAVSREAEMYRAKAMKLAQADFESRHPHTFLYVYAHWLRTSGRNRESAAEVAKQISSCVETLVPPTTRPEPEIPKRDARYEDLVRAGLENLLAYLTVYRYPRATYGLWAPPEANTASQNVSDLEAQVLSKESKLSSYREHCDETWLVMYSLAHPSGAFDFDALVGRTLRSSFDHVVFLDAVSERHVLLVN